MRLRTRGNASAGSGNGNADNDAATAAAAADSRTALGNISNREGNDETEKEQKPKKTKSSGVVERVRRGRSQASMAKEPEPEPEKKPAVRRLSSRTATVRGAAGKSAADKKATTKVAAAKKKAPIMKEAPAKKEATKKKVGVKRSSSDGNDSKPIGRTSKRAKKSESTVAKAETIVSQRATRSRSVASRSNATKKSTERRGDVVEIIPADDNHVVPLDFGLKRDSFNGQNFTYGIAHYDAAERSDPLRCKDYVTDMFQYLYHAETNAHPRPYMDRQEDINAKMRAILVDWLVEVHMKFRLVPETLYLCVHIIDRYCSIVDVARSKLQLVGVTALFLACKHEEIYPPEVRDCVYITDRAYDRQEVLDMEQTLLRVLDWKISLPTAHPFLDRFLSLTKASPMTRHTATYYLERTLQEHDLLEFRPSLVCASAVILALNNPDIRIHEEEYERKLPGLPKILMEYTEFDKDKLMDCMTIVAAKICEPAICASRRHLTAVRKKYEHRKYLSVSSAVDNPSVRFVKENMSSDE